MSNRLKVRVKCRNTNYFLKDLIRKKIKLYDIKKDNDELELIITKDDYEKISKIKTIKKIKIISYYGTKRIENTIKKNSIFFICLLLGIILNIFLSTIVFEIDIETPNKTLEEKVKNDLKTLGIKKYKFKVKHEKLEDIKEKLKEMNKNKIEYLEITEVGTKYIVKVEEKKLNEKEEECLNRDLIAKKNAIITKITSTSGEIVKKKNDYVSKGEIIISGTIHNKEDVVAKRCAKGQVYGETWYKVTVEEDIEKIKTTLTGNTSYGVLIRFFGFNKYFHNNFVTSKKIEYNIIEGRTFPIALGFTKYEEVKEKKEKYSEKELNEKAINLAEKKLLKSLNSDVTVLRKKVLKKTRENSKILVEVFFALEEDITDYKELDAKEE